MTFLRAPGPSSVLLDASCDFCGRDWLRVEAWFVPADESCEWVCPSCEHPNVQRIEGDE